MLLQINSASGVRTSYIGQQKNISRISFKGETDSFYSYPRVLTGNIQEHDLNGIIDGVYRTYFEENLKKVESYAPFISRENAVEVPENEDIVNCLYKGIKSPILEKIEEVGTKTGNKKGSFALKGLCVVFGLGATGLCFNKKKKN